MTTRTRTPRKDRQWIISEVSSTIQDGIGTPILAHDFTADFDSAMGRTQSQVTVSNIRGHLCMTATATPPTANGIWAAGIAWMPESILASQLPSPITDDYDWIWHNIGGSTQGLATGDYLWGKGVDGLIINNRSMRKQRDAFSKLVLVTASATGQNANVFGGFRILYLLP